MQVETKYSIGDTVYCGRIDNGRLVVVFGPYVVQSVEISVSVKEGKEIVSSRYGLNNNGSLSTEDGLFPSGAAAFKHYEKELNKDKT